MYENGGKDLWGSSYVVGGWILLWVLEIWILSVFVSRSGLYH